MVRKKHSAAFAAKEIKTLSELASQYGVHPAQISQWKKQLLETAPNAFSAQHQSLYRNETTRRLIIHQQRKRGARCRELK